MFIIVSGTMRSGTSLLGELFFRRACTEPMHPSLSFANDNYDVVRDMVYNLRQKVTPEAGIGYPLKGIDASSEQVRQALAEVEGKEPDRPVDRYLRDGVLALSPVEGEVTHYGLKSTDIFSEFDIVRRVFPETRLVLMLRDPRDVLASNIGRLGPKQYLNALTVLASVANLHVFIQQRRAESDIMHVRYEDLVSDTEARLRDILAFVNLDADRYAWDVLRGTGIGSNSSYNECKGDGWHAKGGVSTSSIGKFRDKLDPFEVYCVERLLGSTMQEHGYDLESEQSDAFEDRFINQFLPVLVSQSHKGGFALEGLRRCAPVPDFSGFLEDLESRIELGVLLVRGGKKNWEEFQGRVQQSGFSMPGRTSASASYETMEQALEDADWKTLEQLTYDLVCGEQNGERLTRMVITFIAGLSDWQAQRDYLHWKLPHGTGFDNFISTKRFNLVVGNADPEEKRAEMDACLADIEAHLAASPEDPRALKLRETVRARSEQL